MRNPLQEQVGGSHYKDFRIQPLEFAYYNNLNFIQASIIKYVCRYEAKNGIEDLQKARHYIDILIELETRKNEPKSNFWPDINVDALGQINT